MYECMHSYKLMKFIFYLFLGLVIILQCSNGHYFNFPRPGSWSPFPGFRPPGRFGNFRPFRRFSNMNWNFIPNPFRPRPMVPPPPPPMIPPPPIIVEPTTVQISDAGNNGQGQSETPNTGNQGNWNRFFPSFPGNVFGNRNSNQGNTANNNENSNTANTGNQGNWNRFFPRIPGNIFGSNQNSNQGNTANNNENGSNGNTGHHGNNENTNHHGNNGNNNEQGSQAEQGGGGSQEANTHQKRHFHHHG